MLARVRNFIQREISIARNYRTESCVCIGLIYIVFFAILSLCVLIFSHSNTKSIEQIKVLLRHLHYTQQIEFSLENDDKMESGRVNGRLFPQVSELTGKVRFDGWIKVARSVKRLEKEIVYIEEMYYVDGRGLRQTRCESSQCNQFRGNGVVAEECLQSNDTFGWPPLWTIEAFLRETAMTSSFSFLQRKRTCAKSNPIQFRFYHKVFFVCPQDIRNLSNSYVNGSTVNAWKTIPHAIRTNRLDDNDTKAKNMSMYRKELSVYGEKVLLRLKLQLLEKDILEAEKGAEKPTTQIRIAKEQEKDRMWLRSKIPKMCPYIEAPLTTESAPTILSTLLASNITQTHF
ncbi:hypothetical protein ABG067_006072 [Albugo candida]